MTTRFSTYTLADLKLLNRKQLQTLCKIFGVKIGAKTQSLLDALTNVASEDEGVLKIVPFSTDEKEDTLTTVKEKEPIQIALTKFRAQSIGRLYEIEKESKKRKSRNVKIDEDGVKEYFPSVTTVLDRTKTYGQRIALLRWKEAKIRELGKDAFYAMSRSTLTSGTHFHKVISDHLKQISSEGKKTCDVDYLLTEKLEENTTAHNLIKSVSNVLKQITFVFAIESSIQHPLLRYAGTLDCIVELGGNVCLIDWKTSSKYRRTISSCYDYPVQAVAYAGAANFDQQYNFQTSHVCLAIAYEDGSPADLHVLPPECCEEYWLQWLCRLSAFYKDYPWESFQNFRATSTPEEAEDKVIQNVSHPQKKVDVPTLKDDENDATKIQVSAPECRIDPSSPSDARTNLVSSVKRGHKTSTPANSGSIEKTILPPKTMGVDSTTGDNSDNSMKNEVSSPKVETIFRKGKFKLTNILAVTKPALRKYLSAQKK